MSWAHMCRRQSTNPRIHIALHSTCTHISGRYPSSKISTTRILFSLWLFFFQLVACLKVSSTDRHNSTESLRLVPVARWDFHRRVHPESCEKKWNAKWKIRIHLKEEVEKRSHWRTGPTNRTTVHTRTSLWCLICWQVLGKDPSDRLLA